MGLTTANVVESVDPVVQRIPLALRQQYEASWDDYGATCRRNRPAEERAEAYERARLVEERFTAAYVVAQSEHKREKARHAAKAGSGR